MTYKRKAKKKADLRENPAQGVDTSMGRYYMEMGLVKIIDRQNKTKQIKKTNIMKKYEARAILKEKQSELRQAEIILEMHENGVREMKEDMVDEFGERIEKIYNKQY